jgi:WD40 repeat protein
MSIAFSPDGTHLVSGSYDKTLKIWNLHTLECVSTLEGHTYLVNTVCYSNNGKKIASGSNDTTIKIWNTENFNNEAVLTGHTKWVFSA